jgi:hypothetical protein
VSDTLLILLQGLFLIIAIGLFDVALTKDIEEDVSKWKSGISVHHTREAWSRVTTLLPSFLLLAGAAFMKAQVHSFNDLAAVIGITAGLMFFCYWTLFDGGYNHARKFGFFFAGSNDGIGNDALLDRIMMPLPIWARALVKFGGILAFLFLYVQKLNW